MMNFYEKNERTAFDSKEFAQWISFAPFIFQASIALRDFGILASIEKQFNSGGSTLEQINEEGTLSKYSVRVLVEAGLGIGLIYIAEGKYFLTKTGYFILNDELTRVNMDFTQDVCYEGLFKLKESLVSGKPEGLKTFGNWNTFYEALSSVSEQVKKSWFAFDHYYSDDVFVEALSHVLKNKPKNILDIGGNTGKFAIQCCKTDPSLKITIMDLPGQAMVAKKNIDQLGFSGRVNFHHADILLEDAVFPKGFDIVWMSQFLDCFSEEQIVSILKRCQISLNEDGFVYIVEPLWDNQKFPSSALSLQMTSLYFTAIANGNSQMYESKIFYGLIKQSGLEIVEILPQLGVSQTLIKCKKSK